MAAIDSVHLTSAGENNQTCSSFATRSGQDISALGSEFKKPWRSVSEFSTLTPQLKNSAFLLDK